MIDASLVRTLFSYDPESGQLIRRTAPTYKNKVGDVAGHVAKNGYRVIKIKGLNYLAHRLVWLFTYGDLPIGEIDHINGDKADNRLMNLRDVPHQVNVQNLRASTSSSSTGVLGVGPHGTNWRARITVDGKLRTLGTFPDKALAEAAYISAKRSLHNGCTI